MKEIFYRYFKETVNWLSILDKMKFLKPLTALNK